MPTMLCKKHFPHVDSAIKYAAIPDDGGCPDMLEEIILPQMEYAEDDALFIAGTGPRAMEYFLRDIAVRCRELEDACRPRADMWGIDHLLFYPKDIYLLASVEEADTIVSWVNGMEEVDPFRLGLSCRIDEKPGRTIVPVLF